MKSNNSIPYDQKKLIRNKEDTRKRPNFDLKVMLLIKSNKNY